MAITRPAIRAAIPAVTVAAILALIGPSMTPASAATVTVRTVRRGTPGTRRWQWSRSRTPSTRPAPTRPRPPAAACRSAASTRVRHRGARDHGEQWVEFLNTVDRAGRDRHDLYEVVESSSVWPKFGQINESSKARQGRHYSLGYPDWADKPYGFANFLRAARFVNSLYNGRLLPRTSSSAAPSTTSATGSASPSGPSAACTTSPAASATVRPAAREGLRRAQPGRVDQGGLLRPQRRRYLLLLEVPDERRGLRRRHRHRPEPGDARSHDGQRRERRHAAPGHLPRVRGRGASWCPAAVQPEDCSSLNPFGIDPTTYAELYQGSLGTVGQAQRARRGARWTRVATRSSGPTRSPRPPPAAKTRECGAACTAGSPTRPPTSSGSRRSGCSPRTTSSTTSPIRGSGSGSAWSAT